MKKITIFVFASLLLNVAAFAEVGPKSTMNCKDIADKVAAAKAAAQQQAPTDPSQVPGAAGTKAN